MTERVLQEQRSFLYRAAEFSYGGCDLAATGRLRAKVRSLLIVSPPQSPTYDYYLAPRFPSQGTVPVARAALRDRPERWLTDATSNGAFVLFCRYTSDGWLRAVDQAGDRLAGVGLFIDDDIPGLVADRGVPLGYRTRLVLNHVRYRRRLSSRLDYVFVSTEALARREASARPIVLSPAPSPEDAPLSRTATDDLPRPRVAFHSTASHAAEHAWLAPILRAVSARVTEVTIDVHVNRVTQRYWRGFEKADVRPVDAWTTYRAATRARGADVLLAPQIESLVNDVRAPTKRIDAFRMRAALITNAAGVYAPSDAEVNSGMILPLTAEAWIEGLTRLLREPARIARLARLNAEQVSAWEPRPIAALNL